MYFGEGGFTHTDIYTMPVYLRNFYYTELLSMKKEEKKKFDEAKKKSPKMPSIPRMKR